MSYLPPITDGLLLALIPAARSLLDHSGNGRHPTVAGVGLGWVRQNGVYQLRAEGTGRLVVANDATLEAVTDFSVFFAGTTPPTNATRWVLSKRDVGGSQFELYVNTTTAVRLNDGLNLRTASIAATGWANVRNYCVVLPSGGVGNLYTNGTFEDDFNGVSTITADNADLTLLNQYDGSFPGINPYRAILLYNRVLTADEISRTAAFTDSLSSPEISPNRRYFDRPGWVPNGPQTSYGDSGPNLVIDSDMEAPTTAAWTPRATAVLSKVAGSPGGDGSLVLRVTGAVSDAAGQNIVTIGRRYRFRGYARGDGVAAIPTIVAGNAVWTGTASSSWQYFDITDVALSGNVYLWISVGAGWAEFDDVTVEQTNNLLSDGMMEDGTTGEYAAWNSATLTKETGTPHEGVQVLRVAYGGVASPQAGQIALTAGRTYRATGWARGDGTFVPSVFIGTAGAAAWVGTNSAAWQEVDVTIIANNTAVSLASSAGAAGYCEFDQFLVREVFETVGAWDLGVITAGEIADKSSLGNHLTLSGNVAPVFTELGRAASFDGVTGYGSAPYDASLKLADNGSIAFSVKLRSIPAGTHNLISYGGAAYPTGYLISQTDSRALVYWNAGGAIFTTAVGTFVVGEWLRFILNNDNGSLELFVNGASVGSGTSGGAITANFITYVGGHATDWYIDGAVKDVEIKNRIWTPAEIKADYTEIARTPLYYEDMSNAVPTVTPVLPGQRIPGTDYTVVTGSHSVVEGIVDGVIRKWIECVTAGRYWRLNPYAYGARHFSVEKNNAAGALYCGVFLNGTEGQDGAGQTGYWVRLDGAERLVWVRSTGGGHADSPFTAAAYVALATKYDFFVTRDHANEFALYNHGGGFGPNWSLVDMSGGAGTNPFTDGNVTTGTHVVFDMDVGDKHFLDVQYLGPVSPV